VLKLVSLAYIAGLSCASLALAETDANVPQQVMSDQEVNAEWEKLTDQLDHGGTLYSFSPTLVFSNDDPRKEQGASQPTQTKQDLAPVPKASVTPEKEINSSADAGYKSGVAAAEAEVSKAPAVDVKTKAQLRKEKREKIRAEKAERARLKKERLEAQKRREAELLAFYEEEQKQQKAQEALEKAEQARLKAEAMEDHKLREAEQHAAYAAEIERKAELKSVDRDAIIKSLEADAPVVSPEIRDNISTVKGGTDRFYDSDAASAASVYDAKPESQPVQNGSVDERYKRLLQKYNIDDSRTAARNAVAEKEAARAAAEFDRQTTMAASSAPRSSSVSQQDPFKLINEETAKMEMENKLADERRNRQAAARETPYAKQGVEPRIYPREDGVAPKRQYGGLGRQIKFSGMTLQKFPSNRFLVQAVEDGSIADKTGFKFGDRLISINKDTVGKYSAEELLDILSAERGNDASFIVLRDQQILGAIMKVSM